MFPRVFLSFKRFYRSPALLSVENEPRIRRKQPEEFVTEALEHLQVDTHQDWSKLKTAVFLQDELKNVRESAHDRLIMTAVSTLNRLDLAKSYLKHLENEKQKPNLAVIGRYLKLVYKNDIQGTIKADENEILSICKHIEDTHPCLDSSTLEHMVLALSLTKDWKKCLDLMQEIKKTASISTHVYSAIASAAFRNKETKLGWELLQTAISEDKVMLNTAFVACIKSIENPDELKPLFEFLNINNLHCQQEAIDCIENLGLGQKSMVNFTGTCSNCKANLKKFDLTDEEFDLLKESVLQNALIGKDIFIKTNPDEMKKFENFVSKMPKYDIVLDGLNVAYSAGIKKGSLIFSKTVRNVVAHFAKENKTILVLGRVHMAKWPRDNWNYIKENADIFLTQNISQDDPYLLYCALHSGKNTMIVSKDLMRSHKFRLKDKKMKILFDRWLKQKQIFLEYVEQSGRVCLRNPPRFEAIAQQSESSKWHIPYIPLNKEINEKFHQTWLCLK